MRTSFREWYPATGDDIAGLWDEGLVVLDAGAMLGLYRMDQSGAKVVLELLDWLGDRVWVPNQAALEFHRNRLDVIGKQASAYGEIRCELERFDENIRKQVARHSVLRSERFVDEVKRKVTELSTMVSKLEAEHVWPGPGSLEDDAVLVALSKTLDGKVGLRLEVDDEMRKQADQRMARKVPPGFHDSGGGDDVPGDLVIWWEILRRISSGGPAQIGVLFVTEDMKDDWWRKQSGERLGPRPELTKEAHEAGAGVFWIQSLAAFARSGSHHLGWEETAIDLAPVESKEHSPDDGVRSFEDSEGIPPAPGDGDPLGV